MNTPLDIAHAAMDADADHTGKRMRFYERLIESELFLLLEAEPSDDTVRPIIQQFDHISYALVFDTEDRLSTFAQSISPRLASSGRQIVSLLQGQGVGVGLNLGVAPSAILLPPDSVDWLAENMVQPVDELEDTPQHFYAPTGVSDTFLQSLDAKLSTMQGLAERAYLVKCSYASGKQAQLLAFVGAHDAVKPAITQAIGEMLRFGGFGDVGLDVSFVEPHQHIYAALQKVGLRFDLPKPADPFEATTKDRPPKLR